MVKGKADYNLNLDKTSFMYDIVIILSLSLNRILQYESIYWGKGLQITYHNTEESPLLHF